MISKIRKVRELAIGFLINLGASPFAHPPSCLNLLNYTMIKCYEN